MFCSIFEENKDIMLQAQVIEKLVPYIPCNSDKLIQVLYHELLSIFCTLNWRRQSSDYSSISRSMQRPVRLW